MGVCDGINNSNVNEVKNLNSFNNTNVYKINEAENPNSPLKVIDTNIILASRSICKIIYKNVKGTGFLIKMNKGNGELKCLITNCLRSSMSKYISDMLPPPIIVIISSFEQIFFIDFILERVSLIGILIIVCFG